MDKAPRIYRGIKLHDDCKLYKKNGTMNPQIKGGLDRFADELEVNNHKLLSEYKNDVTKVLIDCRDKIYLVNPADYKVGRGYTEYGKTVKEKSKNKLIKLLKENGHELLSDYIDNQTKVLIDYQCGHEPHWITPNNYKNRCGYGKVPKCPVCAKYSEEVPINIQALEEGRKKQISKAEKDLKKLIEKNGHEWISGEYENNRTKILIDFKCGHKPHWITPKIYKAGSGCPLCAIDRRKKRIKQNRNYKF